MDELLIVLGWAGLIIAGIGIYIAYAYSTTPIEKWMVNGPFGDITNQPDTDYIRNEQAYYRLLSIFTKIQITIKDNPERSKALNRQGIYSLAENARLTNAMKEALAVIEVTSNIPGLIGGNTTLSSHISWKRVYKSSTANPALLNTKDDRIKEILDDGIRVYVAQPAKPNAQYDMNTGEFQNSTSWQVRVQFTLRHKGQTFAFPAPSSVTDNAVLYNPATHSKPDYLYTDQPYWADQDNSKA